MKDIITVAVVNFRVDAANKESNLARMCGYVEAAGKQGADLILLPEMCLMGYDWFVDDSVSQEDKIKATETIDGPSCQAIAEITKKYGMYAVFGMSELEKEGSDVLYNSAVAVGPEGVIGAYRKMHPFETEQHWCKKGDDPFMFDTDWGPIGIGICYDTYQFPELMRHYVAKGARLYLNPTALIEEIPYNGSRQAFLDYYKPELEYGVLCNTIYIASSNLVGKDIECYFGGGSCVIGPNISPFFETNVHCYVGDMDNDQETMHMGTIDLSLATRRLAIPNANSGVPDYRPEIYKKFL